MSNLKVYHLNSELNKKIKYPNINITASPISYNKISFTKRDNTTPINKNKDNKIKTRININKSLIPLAENSNKLIINTESTLPKTDEDDQDIEKFKFLLNKLVKNPKLKSIVLNEIISVIDGENRLDHIIKNKYTNYIKKKKSLSFNMSIFKELGNKKMSSISKYNNARLIKDYSISTKRSNNHKKEQTRNDINPIVKSKTMIKSIDIPSLDLLTINTKGDFNDEFLKNVDNFSPSWRDGCVKAQLYN